METPSATGFWKNRYQIDRELGRGGFGVVYLARDQQLHSKPVVIKVLQDQSEPDPYFLKKFQQEIEALARIDHPGVVGVLDVGETPDGKPFLVMQFVEGVTLRSEIGSGGMEFLRVAHILRQVGQALGAAHDKGIYHRDLKPENIMLQRAGETEEYVKLIDFGIAAVRDSQVVAQTQTSKVMGTLSYMAPEQVMGKGGAASDVYSLGVIAFEMLTGRRPDVGPQGVAAKPRELRAGVPEVAQELILKALAYQPEARPAKPRDFGEQLARALGAEPTISSPLPAVASPLAPLQPSSAANLEMAYVLFMDIVAYSKLKMALQSRRIQELGQIVRSTAEFQRAQQSDEVISLPTGDGMALVFFQNPVAPVQCATEISRELKKFPDIQLRMGVHMGHVYRIPDINTNRNVAGGGINLAQRVMDCGDAGHILVSKAVSDILSELGDWEPLLHDLGEAEVKHGVKVNVVNFYTGEVGNPALPEKLRKFAALPPAAPPAPAARQPLVVTVAQPPAPLAQPMHRPVVQYAPAASAGGSRGKLVLAGVVAAVVVGVAAVAFRFGPWESGGSVPSEDAPPSQSSMAPSAGGAMPPSGTPPAPPANQTPGSAPAASGPAVAPQTASPLPAATTTAGERAVISSRPAAARVPSAPSQQPEAAPQTGASTSAAAPAAASQSGTGGDRAVLQEVRQRMIQLAARAGAAGRSLRNMEEAQSRRGLGLRGDMAAARDQMEYLMGDTQRALDERDFETAKRNLDLAERQIERLENFLGR